MQDASFIQYFQKTDYESAPPGSNNEQKTSCLLPKWSSQRVIDGSKQYIPYSEITPVIAMTRGNYRVPLDGKSQQLRLSLRCPEQAKKTRNEQKSQARRNPIGKSTGEEHSGE